LVFRYFYFKKGIIELFIHMIHIAMQCSSIYIYICKISWFSAKFDYPLLVYSFMNLEMFLFWTWY
jgi:hypothetical protein